MRLCVAKCDINSPIHIRCPIAHLGNLDTIDVIDTLHLRFYLLKGVLELIATMDDEIDVMLFAIDGNRHLVARLKSTFDLELSDL